MFSKKLLGTALAVLALGLSAAEFKVDPKVKNPNIKLDPSTRVIGDKFYLNNLYFGSVAINKSFSGTTTIRYTVKQMGKVNPKSDGHFGLHITFGNGSRLSPIYSYGKDWVGIFNHGPKKKTEYYNPTTNAEMPLNQPTDVKIVLSKEGVDIFCGKGKANRINIDASQIKSFNFYAYNWKYELSNISVETKSAGKNLLGSGCDMEVGQYGFIVNTDSKEIIRKGEQTVYDTVNPYQGKYSLKITRDGWWPMHAASFGPNEKVPETPQLKSCTQTRCCGIFYNPVQLDKTKTYTASAYLRADRAITAVIEVFEAQNDGNYWKYRLIKYIPVGTEWKRYSFTFKPEKCGLKNHRVLRIAIWDTPSNQAKMWIDNVQLEEGDKATEFEQTPHEFSAIIEKYGRVFRKDELNKAKVTLRFRNNTAKDETYTVKYKLLDYWDKVRSTGTVTKTVKANSNLESALPIPALPAGHYRYVFEGKQDTVYDEAIFAVYHKLEDLGKVGLDWPMGGWTGDNTVFEGYTPAKKLREFGFGWHQSTEPFRVNRVARKDGTFDFSLADIWIQKEMKNSGMRQTVVLGAFLQWGGTPEWAKEQVGKKKILSKKVWYNYVYATVSHFKNDIKVWEMIGEPNVFLTPEEYFEFLKLGYQAAKKADPTCFVLGCCATADLGGQPSPWTLKVIELGGVKYMDAVSTHLYNDNLPEFGRFGIIGHYKVITEAMKRQGRVLPIWHTEKMYCTLKQGYSSRKINIDRSVYPVSPSRWWTTRDDKQKGAFNIRDAILSSVLGHGPYLSMGAFACNNVPCPRNSYLLEFTHLEYDGSPCPEIPAYNAFAKMLNGRATGVKLIPIGKSAFAGVYKGKKGVLVALWDTNVKGGAKMAVPKGLPAFKAFDFFGEPMNVSKEFQLAEAPFYLQLDGVSAEKVCKSFEGAKLHGIRK